MATQSLSCESDGDFVMLSGTFEIVWRGELIAETDGVNVNAIAFWDTLVLSAASLNVVSDFDESSWTSGWCTLVVQLAIYTSSGTVTRLAPISHHAALVVISSHVPGFTLIVNGADSTVLDLHDLASTDLRWSRCIWVLRRSGSHIAFVDWATVVQ